MVNPEGCVRPLMPSISRLFFLKTFPWNVKKKGGGERGGNLIVDNC